MAQPGARRDTAQGLRDRRPPARCRREQQQRSLQRMQAREAHAVDVVIHRGQRIMLHAHRPAQQRRAQPPGDKSAQPLEVIRCGRPAAHTHAP